MNLGNVKALAELMGEHGLATLEVWEGDNKITLTKNAPQPAASATPVAAAIPAEAAAPAAPVPESEAADDADVLKAPLVGCVYLAAGPGEEPFVAVGSIVEKGQTLCIMEAMKVMNEFTAPRGGVIAEICVENEQLVEYGQPLFRLKG